MEAVHVTDLTKSAMPYKLMFSSGCFVKEQGSALASCAKVCICNKLLEQNETVNVMTWDTDFQICKCVCWENDQNLLQDSFHFLFWYSISHAFGGFGCRVLESMLFECSTGCVVVLDCMAQSSASYRPLAVAPSWLCAFLKVCLSCSIKLVGNPRGLLAGCCLLFILVFCVCFQGPSWAHTEVI